MVVIKLIVDVIKLLDFFKKNLSSYGVLILGWILIFVGTDKLDVIAERLFPNIYKYEKLHVYIFFIAFILLSILWFIVWHCLKNYLPKNKKDSLGIFVAISTENDKQRNRIKNDLVSRLKELIHENGLADFFNIIILDNKKTATMSSILNDYCNATAKQPGKITRPIKKFNKIQKFLNLHFCVWGTIKERQDGVNKYYFDLDGIVVHDCPNLVIKKEISQEFLKIWFKKINFSEEIEFKGFKITAEIIFMAMEYMVGLAAFNSGNPSFAIKLHEKLTAQLLSFTYLPPNLQSIKNDLPIKLASEYCGIAKYYYSIDQMDEAKEFLKKSFLKNQKNYDACILQSLITFICDGDAKKALQSIEQAIPLADGNGVWRYNKAFILMHLEKFEKSLKLYKEITKVSYPREENTLNEVYNFCEKYLNCYPRRIWGYFILGYLQLKKSLNYPAALNHFESFLGKAKTKTKYKLLVKEAKKLKLEIEKFMDINIK